MIRTRQATTAVRCTIYTRVSTVDQAQGEFTSIDNQHEVQWDARGVASGMYFYRLETAEHVETKKMNLLK